jgi:hypothetical protein
MVEEDEAETVTDDTPGNPNDQGGQQNPPDSDKPDDPNGRMFALADATAERVARKETLFVQTAMRAGDPEALSVAYRKHVPFVAAALSVPEASAVAYCVEQLAFAANNQDCDVQLFETSARMKLARLALKGAL